jgi:hypothetical protein
MRIPGSLVVDNDAASPEQFDELLGAVVAAPDSKRMLDAVRLEYPQLYGGVYERMLRAGAKTDSNMFHEYCFRNTDDTIRLQPQFHREWNHIWDLRPERLFVMAPRDHSKTTQTIQRTCRELGENPNLRIKIVSNSDEKASEILGAVGEVITENPYYKEIYPHILPAGEWKSGKLRVQRSATGMRDSSVEALGIFSSATGGRADLLIFDDIVDYRNARQNPALRRQVKDVFYEVWLNLLEPDGVAWVLGTPWHEDDLYGELVDRCERQVGGWMMWRKPCVVYSGKGEERVREPLWPERWTLTHLRDREAEINDPAVFSRQWLLKTISSEEQVLSPPVWRDDMDLSQIPPDWPRFVGIDLASAMNRRGAFTVFFIAALGPNGKRYPLEIIRAKMDFDTIVKTLVSVYERHKPYHMKVETNAFQAAVYTHIERSHPAIPLTAIVTGRQKADYGIGIPSLGLEYDRKLWEVWRAKPLVGEDSVWAAYQDELLSYPAGRNSDIVMANWFTQRAIMELEGGNRPRVRLLSEDYTDSVMDLAIKPLPVAQPDMTDPKIVAAASEAQAEIEEAVKEREAATLEFRSVEQFARLVVEQGRRVDIKLVVAVTQVPEKKAAEYLLRLGYAESEVAGQYAK